MKHFIDLHWWFEQFPREFEFELNIGRFELRINREEEYTGPEKGMVPKIRTLFGYRIIRADKIRKLFGRVAERFDIGNGGMLIHQRLLRDLAVTVWRKMFYYKRIERLIRERQLDYENQYSILSDPMNGCPEDFAEAFERQNRLDDYQIYSYTQGFIPVREYFRIRWNRFVQEFLYDFAWKFRISTKYTKRLIKH